MASKTCQLCTFFIANRMYGIDVMRVQEVTQPLSMAHVPLAPKFIRGLINLRGQISTAISLRDLFEISDFPPNEQMNVVCKLNDVLVSFLVDRIGDVMELESKDFEPTPETIPTSVKRFLGGVYKIPGSLISVIDIDKISEYFLKSTNSHAVKDAASGTLNV